MDKLIVTPFAVDEHPVVAQVQPASFGRFKAYDLFDAAVGYTYESGTLMPQRMPKKEIIQQAVDLVDNPFSVGIHYITSHLDEARPSMLAAFIARRAHYLYQRGFPVKRRSLVAPPRYEYVYGSYKHISNVLDMFKETPPSTLVLAGLDIDSNEMKTDAFRDVIHAASRYQTCLLVVASGCTPHQLHYDKLRIPPASYIHIGSPDLVKGAEI